MAKEFCTVCNTRTKHKRYAIVSPDKRRSVKLLRFLLGYLPGGLVTDVAGGLKDRATTKMVQQCVHCNNIITWCPFCGAQQQCNLKQQQNCSECNKDFYNYQQLI